MDVCMYKPYSHERQIKFRSAIGSWETSSAATGEFTWPGFVQNSKQLALENSIEIYVDSKRSIPENSKVDV